MCSDDAAFLTNYLLLLLRIAVRRMWIQPSVTDRVAWCVCLSVTVVTLQRRGPDAPMRRGDFEAGRGGHIVKHKDTLQ